MFFLIVPGNVFAETDTLQFQTKENAFLKAELILASKPAIYLLLNLSNNTIQLKAKGIVLRELPITHSNFWGDPLPIKPLGLIQKSSFVKPKRIVIKPGETSKPDTFQIEALELEDMPLRYSLNLADNIILNIKPQTDGFFSTIGYAISWLATSLARPFPTLFNKALGKSLTEIDLRLTGQNAQALYWAFAEGMETIILTQ
ncbi:hypothetical protein KKA14_10535 [bacterium]|nr:hypothetical protein [bacterium]